MLLRTLRGYRRSWAAPDAVAGLTLLVIALPEQLATARLAGMPPVTGLYAFIAGALVFAVLGTNRQLSVGADSTIAPLMAAELAHLAAAGSGRYVELAGILAVMVGLLVAMVWLLRLGWVADFLSTPIVIGFLAGIAVVIVVHQLPDLLGLPGGSGTTLHRIGHVLSHLRDINGWTVGVATSVLAIVVAAGRIDRRVPGALIALIASTVAVGALGLHNHHGVAVLGAVAHGAPHFGLHGLSWSVLGKLAPTAVVVALVVITQSAATTRAFADQDGYRVDVGRDLMAVGGGSVLAGLSGSFAVNASPPRTAAVASAGGRSQAAALLAVVVLLALIPGAAILKNLPLATLAGVLVFVASRVFRGRDLAAIARFDRLELALALVTLLAVALWGVEQGIGLAVALAILDRTRRTAQLRLHALGRVGGTTSWTPTGPGHHLEQVPGVMVILFGGSLWYANADGFQTQLRQMVTAASPPPRAVVLDAVAVSDIDYTGIRALREVLGELERRNIAFALARADERVRQSLERSGLLEEVGADRLYATVNEAAEGMARAAAGPDPPGLS